MRWRGSERLLQAKTKGKEGACSKEDELGGKAKGARGATVHTSESSSAEGRAQVGCKKDVGDGAKEEELPGDNGEFEEPACWLSESVQRLQSSE